MAIVLGSCGCGCGDPCLTVKKNCNNKFVFRTFEFGEFQPGSSYECYSSCFTENGGGVDCLGAFCPEWEYDFDPCEGDTTQIASVFEMVLVDPNDIFSGRTRGAQVGTRAVTSIDYPLDINKIEKRDYSDPDNPEICYFKYNLGDVVADRDKTYFFYALNCHNRLYAQAYPIDENGYVYGSIRYDELLKDCID